VINDYADAESLLPSDTSFFEFSECKSTTLPDLSVVADCGSTDGRTEGFQWTNTKGSSLGLAGLTTAELASWLVEPGANAALPVFMEMPVREDVIMLDHIRLHGLDES